MAVPSGSLPPSLPPTPTCTPQGCLLLLTHLGGCGRRQLYRPLLGKDRTAGQGLAGLTGIHGTSRHVPAAHRALAAAAGGVVVDVPWGGGGDASEWVGEWVSE